MARQKTWKGSCMGADKMLLFIPAYNCEKQIARVLGRINAEVARHIHEVLVVENCSTDHTLQAAPAALADCPVVNATLVRNLQNYGFGGSHSIAIDYALKYAFDYLIILHGDDQADPGDMREALEKKSYRDFPLYLGARFHPRSTLTAYSALRNYGNRLFNLLTSAVIGQRVYDTGAGLNIYSTELFKNGMYRYFPRDLTFSAWLLLDGVKQGYALTFFPMIWRSEDQVSNARIIRQGWIILKLLWRYRFGQMLEDSQQPHATGSYTVHYRKRNGMTAGPEAA